MPAFSIVSKAKLATCHVDLQDLFTEVIKHFDCTILWGHRGQEAQNAAFHGGYSKKRWPQSKHNERISMAVDVAPYPVDWNDVDRFRYFAGVVKGIAIMMGFEIIWGGDWDRDTQLQDQTFNDLAHFELVNVR